MAMMLVLFTCTGAVAEEEAVAEVYPLATPDAGPIIEVLEMVVGDDGKIVHDKATGRLIVLAPPSAHEKIKPILEELNVPPKNVRLDIVITDSGKARDSGAGIGGSGEVVVTPRGTSTRARIRPYARHRTSTSSSDTTQTLVVRSGGEGRLRVGEEVPFVDTLIDYGRRWGYIAQSVTMRQVGASLTMQPTVIGDGPMIRIRVTPELSGLTEEGARRISYARAATEVTVRDGQPFTLGGFDQQNEVFSKFLIGLDKQGNQRQMQITATPHILNP